MLCVVGWCDSRYELPSDKAFSDKSKIMFSSYAMINVVEFYFARLVSCAS